MSMRKYLDRLCKNIVAGKFNDKKYRRNSTYHGVEIMTMPLFCSYGEIGFTVTVYAKFCTYEIQYDGDLDNLMIDEEPWKDYINLLYLEENEIHASEKPAWSDKPRSKEFECYTPAGEDMIFALEKPVKHLLQEYIDDFDINESVALWWPDGRKMEGKGVPFNNMKEHYEDYEAYLKWLQKVCNKMPY